MSKNINEDLKGRMLRHISALWGTKNTDALDPLVRMLVEALAGELQKTHFEIDNFEKRILEKIALLMTPGILSTPYTAHAIAHAQSVDPINVISKKTQFFHAKKSTNEKEAQLGIFFSPVEDVKLFDGNIKYIVAGNKVFLMETPAQKSIHISGDRDTDHTKSIWLGLKLDPTIETIDGMSFYFDFKNTEQRQQLFSIFHLSKWFLGSTPLNTTKGLTYGNSIQKDLFFDFDTMYLIEKEVRQYYDDQFVTISDKHNELDINNQLKKYPEEFTTKFTKSDLSKFKEDLLWIKVITPSVVEERILIDLFVSINAFPVINRKLKDFFHRLKGVTNIIPFTTESYEYFLSVHSLRDSTEKPYRQIPFTTDDQEMIGTYSIRQSGTERIDPRASKEYLKYVVDLVRDESAAFSSYGQDTVTSLVKDLDKILAQVKQRIKLNKNYHTDSDHYLTVEQQNSEESFFIEYWTTNSIYANGIHAGTKLMPYKGSEIKADTAMLLSSTSGGKSALDPSRHIIAYKYAVLSHDKIVTVEDIKAFCYYELGDKIEAVTVRKGLVLSDNPNEGLVRCVEVILERKKNDYNLQDGDWDALLKTLQTKMELRSSLNLNIRLILKDLQVS